MSFPGILLALLSLCFFSASLAEAASVDLVSNGAIWRYRLGTSEASTPDLGAWRQVDFMEDGTWSSGGAPIGYGEADIVTTVPSSAGPPAYLSVFTRRTFVVTNTAMFSDLVLSVRCDDGYVAWINGQEVLRDNMPAGAVTINTAAINANEPAITSTTISNNLAGLLITGTNVLAIQFFNANTTSSDLLMNASLVATFDDIPPQVIAMTPAINETVRELNSVQVSFSEPVLGVDAADLVVNGVPANDVFAVSPTIFTFQVAQPSTGTVTFAFAVGHGITDANLPPNAFAGTNWTVTLDPNAVLQPFIITEFMASNSGNRPDSIRDEDGSSSDWIEIFNPSITAGNIGGYYLTDTTNPLTRWRIPDGVTVPARGYLVIFASAKNRTNIAGRLHTNFQLNDDGEFLALLNPSGVIVSEFAPLYPPQSTDVSYGRDRGNPELLGYFVSPTPGADNATGGAGFAPEVVFSHASQTFIEPFQLTLSVPDTNSVIRYTLVNTAQNYATATNIPTATSTLYNGPITVSNTVQVRARAFPNNPNFFPGPPQTQIYIAVNTNLADFTSPLPIVVLHTMSSTALSGGYPTLDNSIVVATFENTGGSASLLQTPQLVKRAGINLRGSSTQGHAKGSYALELWDEFNEDEEAEFLGLPRESDWVLYAPNIYDPTGLHNPIMHEVARRTGQYASRTRFVEVFLRNGAGALSGNIEATGPAMGDYLGLYVLEEKVKRDGSRLDLDELQREQSTEPDITGGYLIKIDRQDGNETRFTVGGVNYLYQDPDGWTEMGGFDVNSALRPAATPGRAAQAAYLTSYLNLFINSLQGATLTNATGTNHYSNYLDIPTSLDHHIVNVLTMNVDAYRLSGYFHKPRNGKFAFGPVWDVDRGLGTSARGGDWRAFNPRAWMASNPLGASDYGTDFFQGTTTPAWMARLFSDLDFWQQWIDRYQELRTSVIDTNRLVALVDSMANEIRSIQPRNYRRWQGTGNADPAPRAGVNTTPNGDFTHTFPSPGTFEGEIEFQKRWLVEHVHFMDTNLLNRPQLLTPAGSVGVGTTVTLLDLSGKSGTKMYYTLDGSDPRAPQGRTNVAAIEYTGPITITNNVRIRVRAVNASHRNLTGASGGARNPILNSTWSGDIAATYYTEIPSLRVTEIMYNPPRTPGGDTDDSDNFEYIELKNIGATTLNLTGFKFTNGISFDFTGSGVTSLAPGDYVLVVANLSSFNARYGPRDNIAGVFGGALNNGGERITLVGPRLEPILDFVYEDDWYGTTDGLGFSLTVVDENAPVEAWDTRANWRISRDADGSPGQDDGGPRIFPLVLVNEALTHTDLPDVDAIELWNAGTEPADLGGWFLSDNVNNPKKYVIPGGTIIPPNGYLVIDENTFNAGGNGFALSSGGEEVYLFSGDGVDLTGYIHGFAFAAAANGVTFGRYVNSQGDEHFVAQAQNTLGATNSLPQVGPVIISEIMYHPPERFLGNLLVDNALDEFIEIQNISSAPVDLFDGSHPSNTWHLRGSADFDLPEGVTLPPNGFALLVNFNPLNAEELAAFRARNFVAESVPVLGPYQNKLDNSSGSVRLTRPDNPNTNGSVPYIHVERVDYRDRAPWPEAADGPGPSLHRIVASTYGNDPTNWLAARPSPGNAFVGGDAPVIVQQPQDFEVLQGVVTNLTVMVSSPTTVSYQWRFNGSVVPGATNAVFDFGEISVTDAGSYSVTVFNGGGVAYSDVANVTVRPLPIITSQPLSVRVNPSNNVPFSVSATGTGPLAYQWRFNGVEIPGATTPNLVVSNAQLFTDAGLYDVRVTDDIGSIWSAPASLIVMVRPVITNSPVPVSVVQGGTAVFTVVAGPDHPMLPINYRWLRGGTTFQTDAPPYLILTNVQANTQIRVAVTNLAGSVASGNIALTVLADADGDGIADIWELANGFNTNDVNDASLDSDGDGMTNREEYLSGTDPSDPESYLHFEPLQVVPGDQAVIEFTAVSNLTYTVQSRDSLSSTGWVNKIHIFPAPTNRTIRLTNEVNGAGSEFYRAVTPLVP